MDLAGCSVESCFLGTFCDILKSFLGLGHVPLLLSGWIFRLQLFGVRSYFLLASKKLNFCWGTYSTQGSIIILGHESADSSSKFSESLQALGS